MDAERYNAYTRIRGALGEARACILGDQECELLCDVAEGLFLSRATDDEVCELEWMAATTLAGLVEGGRLSDLAAEWLWVRVAACGPRPPQEHTSFRAVTPPLLATA